MDLNPVEQRLLLLCHHWQAFRSEVSKRLLIWQIPDNAVRMCQCFFEVQKHDTAYTTGDLFIVFDAPFENSMQYARALKEALKGQYEASKEELEQQGITPDWQFTPTDFADSASGFISSMTSFVNRHHEISGQVVATLMPQSIANEQAFNEWLLRALNVEIPQGLRLAIVDSAEHSQLSHLLESANPLVYIDSPQIDALTTAQETFAQEAAVGPGAVFRNFLIGLVSLVEKGSVEQVKVKAEDALAFARKQQWLDQEVVVSMLVAGALLKEKRFDEAAEEYKAARKVAQQATDAGHPAGLDLVLQTWFGEAGAHFAAGNDELAAECYDQAGVVAQRIPNLILSIEAFRMAAVCYARLNNHDAAIDRGSLAMRVGEQLEPDVRAMTTLPLAAFDLLRLIEPERVNQLEDIKHRQDEQQEKARQTAEQSAIALEATGDAQQFAGIQDRLDADNSSAELTATRGFEAVVFAGSESFKQYFARGRSLLGEQWPLASAIAIPPAPPTEGSG